MNRRLGVSAALVEGRLLPGDVSIADGLVEAVGLVPAVGHRIAAPGLVDLQVNGYAGIDLADAGPDDLSTLRRALLADGVTAFAPTLVTGNPATTRRALRVVRDAPADDGAQLLGIHLEGPVLSPAQLGTHPGAWRRDPDGTVEELMAQAPVRIVTLAPELPGTVDLIARLTAAGVVVLLGHSDADAAAAHAGFDAGASGVTHLFNAMRPLLHRDPGLAGVALTRPGVVVTIIVDGHHLADETVRLVFAAAPGRVALVTDATAASGMPDGPFRLGEVDVVAAGGVVRNAAGALAGSALTLAAAIRGAVAVGVPVATALTAATTVPAGLVRRPDLGRLVPGARADIAVLDADLHVERVLSGGREH